MENPSECKKVLMYDPPGGWKFGFPRPYKPLPGETLKETLIRNGYPPHWVTENITCRFWESEVNG